MIFAQKSSSAYFLFTYTSGKKLKDCSFDINTILNLPAEKKAMLETRGLQLGQKLQPFRLRAMVSG